MVNSWQAAYVAWFISLVSILGSLFFSEVMGLPPCALCWYQRIALYPLGLILAIGILYEDKAFARYSWPFVIVGTLMAFYHNLLYYHVIPETLSMCTQGVSCTTPQIEWLGFITIPLLSLFAFLTIGICLWFFRSSHKGASDEKK